ncbi:hypothetical protein CONCODRAFT_83840 [Conidiobolus coronatus NRRL 28638]|uniref:Uncharacterized protein n=1 Tax=Conidiobolus coronatus (strain ATCC 28846 / CBS 209.66 / NRRL 28638) TaxID=796925 RepID=A0A137PCV5_CONC2|nr:hypothetical protein CONCODRAFT_83840 [Conidiobolus coronatus NRRL 28638]|eukprot:KXN72823.1 hypothetical protein CONCODRAFT_83840 [Conidiobolus coronatus NRRL 28638]
MSYNSDKTANYLNLSPRERPKSLSFTEFDVQPPPIKTYASSVVDIQTQPRLYSRNNRRSYQSLPKTQIIPNLLRIQNEEFVEISKPKTLDGIAKDAGEACRGLIESEVEVTLKDLDLLASMNTLTTSEYIQINGTLEELCASSNQIKQTYLDMIPYLNQVNEICNSVDYLELLTDELDQFSYYLEQKINSVKERKSKFK